MDIDPRNGMEILTDDQCWELLEREEVARLAVAPAGRPDIFPINFVVVGRRPLFRTAEGSKLASVVLNSAVAMEIDGYSAASNEAWSVVVYGTAHVVQRDDDAVQLESVPLFPWNSAPKFHFVEVIPSAISGRRFVADGRPLT